MIEKAIEIYKKMFLIRQFEMILEDYFTKGLLRGTTHSCIGQEAVAVSILDYIDIERDFVTSTHRGHGHFLAITGDVFALASEVMGKRTGVVSGLGGSQHLQHKNFYTNGITGGMIPIGVGIAFAKKLKGEEGIVISFLGDGAMNEGYVMEALNMAKVYDVPIIFVLENNCYAMSSITRNLSGGEFGDRVRSFGLRYVYEEAIDVLNLWQKFGEIYREVLINRSPVFIECRTYRFCGHSKSDKREYVLEEEEDFWREHDPLLLLREKILRNIELDELERQERYVKQGIVDAFKNAEQEEELGVEEFSSKYISA